MEKTLGALIDLRLSRRQFIGGALAAGAALYTTTALPAWAKSASLKLHTVDAVELLPDYQYHVIATWGDAVTATETFGYNCDYNAYMPLNGSADHGLLCTNHEYTEAKKMFPPFMEKTVAMAELELAAHGHSVLEIRKDKQWSVVKGGTYNRRITGTTPIVISGAAAGSERLKTSYDTTGALAMGTLGNCAGGKTPWGTVLIAEENFNNYFGGNSRGLKEEQNYLRYGVAGKEYYGFSKLIDRFHVNKEVNEANRFGWVVEYNPYDPKSVPKKRTALGRFKHESATVALAADRRVVVYSGDDENNEYLYRFVSHKPYTGDADILDDGILYVAQFDEKGMRWLPLIFGEGKLTPENGFHSQADVLIETRLAADLLGATPMDRPEDIEVHPNGTIYVALTNNRTRTIPNIANPRRLNIHGHIISLTPPDGDHGADNFTWDIVMLGGKEFSCPDNLAIHPDGSLWIATDGQPKTLDASDSLYKRQKDGLLLRFLNAPKGAEVTGPEFTPDGKTVFVSIQHPDNLKPYVIAITHKKGRVI